MSQYSDIPENESDEELIEPVDTADTEINLLVHLLSENKIILSKSQLPGVKEKQAKAAENISDGILHNMGKRYDSKSILKKIANLKTRIKQKTDKNKTGNRKIKILPWEETFRNLMDHDDNPVFTKIQGNYFSTLLIFLYLNLYKNINLKLI